MISPRTSFRRGPARYPADGQGTPWFILAPIGVSVGPGLKLITRIELAARSGSSIVCSVIVEPFAVAFCAAAEMGRSVVPIPRQNLFNFCSEPAWAGGVGLLEFKKRLG
jgi:hypothetical protein